MPVSKRLLAQGASGFALTILLVASWTQLVVAANNGEPTEHLVEIVKFQFVPPVLAVKKGDTVTWVNRDIVPHTATSMDRSLDTGEIQKGQSRSLVIMFDTSLDYICSYHPTMKGEIKL